MAEIVITGGSGGLGSALARRFASAGRNVVSLSSADLDVTDRDAVRRWFSGREVELLVCAAGITRDAPLARLPEAEWDAVWNVGFEGALACAEQAVAGMKQRGEGHIVFVSSHSALHPPVGQAAYAAAKAALLGLTTDLAVRWGADNIRVNAVLPGFLETKMTAAVRERRREEVKRDHALGRFNTCGKVAAFIEFLHHELPHTSGQIFQLDSRPGSFGIR